MANDAGCPATTTAHGAVWPPWGLPNMTNPACTAPRCGNNTAVIQACCAPNASNPSLTTLFSPQTGDQPYTACYMPDDQVGARSVHDAGQAYADCLLRAGATGFRCNYPLADGGGVDGGGAGSGAILDTCPPPAYDYLYYYHPGRETSTTLLLPPPRRRRGANRTTTTTVCGLAASALNTAALRGCGCDEPHAALQGCFAYCAADGGRELERCMGRHNESRGVFCSTWTTDDDADEADDDDDEAGEKSGAAASMMMVVGLTPQNGTKLALAVGVLFLVSQLC